MGQVSVPVDVLFGGATAAPLLELTEPLSFWGGVATATGEIIDRNHPQRGQSLAGRALVTGATRGSSSSSSTLMECARLGTGPSLILLTVRDPIIVLGVAATWEIYAAGPALACIDAGLTLGMTHAELTVDGTLLLSPASAADGADAQQQR